MMLIYILLALTFFCSILAMSKNNTTDEPKDEPIQYAPSKREIEFISALNRMSDAVNKLEQREDG